MALDASLLAPLMFATSGAIGPESFAIWNAYATGVVNGLKLGTATMLVGGSAGSPGQASGIGAIHGGPVAMLPIVIANFAGIIPPIPPQGAPTPLQALFFLAVAQIGTHTLAFTEVKGPSGPVAVGAGLVAPGGYIIDDTIMGNLIKIELLKLGKGKPLTPIQLDTADAIAKSTKQIMALATTPVVAVGGAPVAPPVPVPPLPLPGIIS